MENRPIVGTTMRDPAGTGSRIGIGAFTDPAQYEFYRPIIIGDTDIMEQAKGFVGHPETQTHRCKTVVNVLFQPGTADVLHLPLITDVDTLELAKVSVKDGNAAFQYVKKVIELAMTGEVDTTCTSVLNEEATDLALTQDKGACSDGYTYLDGHMETYATYAETRKYTMMLVHHDFRVVHVSVYVSFREACEYVKRARAFEATEIADQACKDMSIESPRIVVAGLNPHCDENGLFGRKEIEEIIPAIEMVGAEGTAGVTGPCPPDSVFSQALGGWYDIVVCMYHDQGHIPLRTIGSAYDRKKKDWEVMGGVNVVLGLPIVRASVDHGTDFYHAGKGNGSEKSLINAMKYATRMVIGRKKGVVR